MSYFERIDCPLIASAPHGEATAASAVARPSTSLGHAGTTRRTSLGRRPETAVRPASSYTVFEGAVPMTPSSVFSETAARPAIPFTPSESTIQPFTPFPSTATHCGIYTPHSITAEASDRRVSEPKISGNEFLVPERPRQFSDHQTTLQRSFTSPHNSKVHRPPSARDVTPLPTITEHNNLALIDRHSSSSIAEKISFRSISAPHGEQESDSSGMNDAIQPTSVGPHIFFSGPLCPPPSTGALTPTPRPMTAPMQPFEDTLSDMVPPRRELPFARSGSSKLSRPTSSSQDLPPLPKPRLAGDKTEHAKAHDSSVQVPLNDTAKLRPDQASTKRPASAKEKAGAKRPMTAPRSTPVSEPFRPELLEQRASNPLTRNERAVQQAPLSVESLAALLEPLDSPSSNKENLAQYASQPHDVRAEAVEALIAQMLDDENFTTLCEDVVGCWKRIGLER